MTWKTRETTISPFSMMMMMTMMICVMMSCSSSLSLKELPCDVTGCCDESNMDRGPLDLSTPAGGFDARLEDEKTYLYHCLRYFTQFHWYRLQRPNEHDYNDDRVDENDSRLEPFPWGQRGRVSYLSWRSDNQTVLIPKVRREDAGIYVFMASNGSHQVAGKFRLQVDCREPGPSFATSEQHVQSVQLGANKTLRCAVNLADCAGKFYQSNVFWIWRNSTSVHMLKNDTLSSVSVVCDRDDYFGQTCDVHIHRVGPGLFDGEFICKLDDREDLNQTVRLVPIRTDVISWLPYVLGVAGGVVVVAALIGFTWWRYGHRVEFFCRSQPDRGEFEADAALLHGEDYEGLVRDTLRPGVRAWGYSTLEDSTAANKLEVTENLKAVESSHTVLLAFSARELAEEGHINFLTHYVFNRKSRSTVLFIRCPDNDNGDNGEDGEDVRRVWNNKALSSFKVLRLPPSLLAGTRRERGLTEARDEDKFWYGLKKNLPKLPSAPAAPSLPPKSRTPGEARSRHNTRSTESHRPLMMSDAERSSAGATCSTTTSSALGTTDVEAGHNGEEAESLSRPPQPPAAFISGSAPQPSTSSANNENNDDEVFTTPSSRGRPQKITAPVSIHPEPAVNGVPGSFPLRTSQAREEPENAARNPAAGSSPGFSGPESSEDPDPPAWPADPSRNLSSSSSSSSSSTSPTPTSRPSASAGDDPGRGGRGIQEEAEDGGKILTGSRPGEEGCGGSQALLQSQESGYHSPGSPPEVPAFRP